MKKINLKLSNENIYKLEKNYKEALKDSKLKDLIKRLNIDDVTAMLNIEDLKSAIKDKENSLEFHGYEECKNVNQGYVTRAVVENNKLYFVYDECSCMKDVHVKNNVELFSVSKNLKDANMKCIYTDDKKRKKIIEAIKEFYDNYGKKQKAIYLYGTFGSGKTYILSALLNKLAEKNIKSIIIHVPELMRSIKESFNDLSYKDKMEALMNVEILLLDDIGAEYLTEWTRDEILEPILNYRMENNLATFFTSNYSIDELEKHFSLGGNSLRARRILDRIKTLAKEVDLISESRR